MGKRILVPVDGSEQSREACDFAMREHPEAEFVLLHVINPTEAGYSAGASFPAASEEWYEHAKEDAQELLEELEAENEGATVTTDTVVGKPARAIVEYAAEHDVDRIVMGSHGRSGVTRILLGSVAENVVRNATVPVTVAR
ncbi:Nucleotide-binding universal stress protein, UspA family [Halorientalis persicus]|uniref:Nucleotide-binding universal stress protein, UspA family n=1 Tax=Halorientalis persicus TaxID=1367881 RepID=A0A1H8DWH6_9EURY|nr:universal stress protein [Halorientalis persicus]SEN11204.1 Nucleotide-binding universal stress protein, UspA family [Halorientalis persicus]